MGHKEEGSKVYALCYPLTLSVTRANEQERARVEERSAEAQAITSGTVELAFVDQAYAGDEPAAAAAEQGVLLEVINLPEAEKGFVLLPKRWVVERSFTRKTRFRLLVRDCERLPRTVAELHFLALACLMLSKTIKLFSSPS